MSRQYAYVGPSEIRERARARPRGTPIRRAGDVVAWAKSPGQDVKPNEPITVTFVVGVGCELLIADRHSEHVACAGGDPVLAAGEMTFDVGKSGVSAEEVSNQSTGYCPEPESWPAVARALDAAGIGHPGDFTTKCTFRRCGACAAINIVKEGWFYCDVCGAELDASWNFDPSPTAAPSAPA